MPVARWVILSSSLAACTPLRMTTPETGAGGEAGSTAGAAGSGGAAGAGATAGTGGVSTAGTLGTGRGGAGGTAGAAEPAGLIAHWLFNEGSGTSVADSSGNGQPMTLSPTGAGWTSSGHEGGGAVTFDGAAGFADMMPTASQALYSYPVDKLTFSAWVRPNPAAASRAFATAVARAHEDYSFEDFWLGLMNGKPGCIIHNPDWGGAVSGGVAPAGVWTHIACTYATDGQITLYVNGGYGASATSGETLGPIPPRILVGAAESDPGTGSITLQAFFPGAIDDVRIYNETLTPSEVTSIAR